MSDNSGNSDFSVKVYEAKSKEEVLNIINWLLKFLQNQLRLLLI